ncbi:MAG: hypothetical protein AB1629_05210 [Candidatus Omnitrophota bacterium]
MLKKIIKILLVIIVVLGLLFLVAFLVFKIKGKDIVEKQLSVVFTSPAKIQTVSLRFPLSVSLKGFEVENFLKTDLSVSVNPLGLFSGKIILNNISLYQPQLRLVKLKDGAVAVPLKQSKQKTALPIILGLLIRNGRFIYLDRSLDDYQLNIYDIDLRVSKRGLGSRIAFNFNGSADIGQKLEQGENFQTNGWVDWTKKDMDGILEINDVNTNYILPFYKNLLGSGANPATMDFKATMNAKDNDLKIECHMELSGLAPEPKPEEQPSEEKQKEISIIGDLASIFSSPEGKISLDFTFNTKLDNPKFEKADLTQGLVGSAAKGILSKPPQDIVSTVEKIGDKLKEWKEEKSGELKDKNIEEIINIFR